MTKKEIRCECSCIIPTVPSLLMRIQQESRTCVDFESETNAYVRQDPLQG